MRYKNDKKISNLSSPSDSFFQAQNAPKSVFGIDVKNIDFRIKNIKNMFFSLL